MVPSQPIDSPKSDPTHPTAPSTRVLRLTSVRTQRPTIQPPVIIPTRSFLCRRVLSRPVECCQEYDPAHPAPLSHHPAHDTPSLSETGPTLANPRVTDHGQCRLSSGSLQNPGSQAIDLRAFGPAFVHLLPAYRRACARASHRRSGTFAETNRCALQAKKWTELSFVSASLRHAGANLGAAPPNPRLQASSRTQCHLKSRWVRPETADT